MSAYFVSSRGLASRMLPRGTLSPVAQELFGAYEQGAMYDPEITGSLFQDSAFTVPGALEQPVGGILDLSGRGNHASQATTTKRPVLSRRVNLLTNSGFVGHTVGSPGTPPTGWVNAHITGQIVAAPVGVRLSVTGTRRSFRQTVALSQGTTIVAKASVEVHSGILAISTVLGNVSTHLSGLTYFLDGIEVPGSATVPEGVHDVVMTAAVSTAGGSVNIDCGAGVQRNATGDVTIFNASLTLATDAHLPYQRVNAATDYDADPSKFPAYLRFDGVDDALQTGNINFTGTDKMTVCAGVTKLSDPATGVSGTTITELTTSGNGPGSVSLFGSWTSVSAGNPGLACSSAGTTRANAIEAGVATAAPFSGPVTVAASIPTSALTLRANGSVIASSSNSLGTGTYANAALYIGARAGASVYFNGRLYSLIFRGAQSSLSQIEATEAYIKQKMRLP